MTKKVGLKWPDLYWEDQNIKVCHQLTFRRGGVYAFTSPKISGAMRAILLGEGAIYVLHTQLDYVNRLRIEKGVKWKEYDLIFPSVMGAPIHPANLRRSFRKLLGLADLPHARFHDLRHTAASLMLNYGVPLLVASKRLGHAKPSITMDVYGT